MRSTLFLMPALAVTLFAAEKSALAQRYYGPPPFAYGPQQTEQAWEQRGFYEGMVGAEHDYWNHRQPNVNNRDEYRDPDSIPRWARHEYREGFARGYYLKVRQLYYGGGRFRDEDEDDQGWR